LIACSVGNLKDEVLSGVLPTEACHLLLGGWQFDRNAIHNGRTNTYSFKLMGCSYTLTPLPLSQVQPTHKPDRVGNTSEKILFLGETRVEKSINKGK